MPLLTVDEFVDRMRRVHAILAFLNWNHKGSTMH